MKASITIKNTLDSVLNTKSELSSLVERFKAFATKVGYFYKVGDQVSLGNARFGEVKEVYTDLISLEIDGVSITREASVNNPAYLVIEPSGHAVLRLSTEIDSSSRDS